MPLRMWKTTYSHLLTYHNSCHDKLHALINDKIQKEFDNIVTEYHTLFVQPIEQITPNNTDTPDSIKDKLYNRERYWINKLKTVYPQGLNWTADSSSSQRN